jgi:hypothetical protein
LSPNFFPTGRSANDPEHWRMRAIEARAIADSFRNDEARQRLLSIAASSDRLAKLAEKQSLLAEERKRD